MASLELAGQAGAVTELDPPRTIAWTWGVERFRFDLEPDGGGCRLVFTHAYDAGSAEVAQVAAGWEAYLDRLGALIDGGELSEADAHAVTAERHRRYAERFGVDPAPGRGAIAALPTGGGLVLDDDGPALRLERRLTHPVDRVWRALTETAELEHWFRGSSW